MAATGQGWKYWVARTFQAALLVVGAGAGCDPSFGPPSGSGSWAQIVEIRIQFANHYAEVAATYSGTKGAAVFSASDAPGALNDVPETSPATYGPVVPTQIIVLPQRENLFPAAWVFRVKVQAGATLIIDATCNIDLNNVYGGPTAHVVKVLEGTTPASATCNPESGGAVPPIPPRDLAILDFAIPGPVIQGSVVPIPVPVWNRGGIMELFQLNISDAPLLAGGSAGSFAPLSPQTVSTLAIGETRLVTFNWNTAGATPGRHLLRAEIPPVSGETSTGDNVMTLDITVAPPPVRDISVEAVTAPTPVLADQNQSIAIQLKNNGNIAETVTAGVTDTPQGGMPANVGTSAATVLSASGNAGDVVTVYIPWTPAIPLGTHVLTATVPLLSGETVTANNTRTANVSVQMRDVQAQSVSVPAAANIGAVVPVTVTVRNNGSASENVIVTLTAQPPGSGPALAVGTQTVTVGAGASEVPTFNWDTRCQAPAGNWVLSAQLSVPVDTVPGNNSVASGPIALAVDRELSIAFVNPPASGAQGMAQQFVVALTNGASVSESAIDVTFSSVRQGGGNPGVTQRDPRLPVNLACGERKELIFTWIPPSTLNGNFNLTATVATAVPGDSPADNTATITVNVP